LHPILCFHLVNINYVINYTELSFLAAHLIALNMQKCTKYAQCKHKYYMCETHEFWTLNSNTEVRNFCVHEVDIYLVFQIPKAHSCMVTEMNVPL